MAGLLDALNSQDGIFALGLLDAASPKPVRTTLGSGLLQAMMGSQQWQNAREDRDLKRRATEMQIADMAAQMQQRTLEAQRMQGVLDMVKGLQGQLQGTTSAANQDVVAKTGNLAPTVQNAQVQTGAMQARGAGSNPLYGVPMEAINFDLGFNQGKNIPGWLYEQGKRNPQVHGNYLIDMNHTPDGVLPSLSVSANGQTTGVRRGPDGQPQVYAPDGALSTAAAYQAIEQQIKAGLEPFMGVDADNKPGVIGTRLGVANQFGGLSGIPGVGGPAVAAPAQNPAPQAAGGQPINPWRYAPAPADPTSPEAAARQKDAAEVDLRQWVDGLRAGRPAPSGAAAAPAATAPRAFIPTGQSPAEKSRTEATTAYDVEVQKDLAARRKTIYDAGDAVPGRLANIQQLTALLAKHDGGALSERGLELAKMANSLGFKLDPELGNKEAAAALSNSMALELRSTAGGAGMPGALSDGDRRFLSAMVPGLTTSAQGRQTMTQYLLALEQRKSDVAQAARNYEAKYGRLDNGFFNQLSAWSNAHPLFTKR